MKPGDGYHPPPITQAMEGHMMTDMKPIPMNETAQDFAMVVETWQVRALLRIVGECRNPESRDDEWFRDLAARAELDLSRMETLNPKVAA